MTIEDRRFKPSVVEEMSQERIYRWCSTMIVREGADYELDDQIIFVIEDYIINPKVYKYDHQGDKGIAMQVIGSLQLTSRLVTGKPAILSPVVNKPAGYGFLGGKYRKNAKGAHTLDALAHAAHFAVTQNIADIAVPQKEPQTIAPKSSSPRILRIPPDEGWRRKDNPPSSDKGHK